MYFPYSRIRCWSTCAIIVMLLPGAAIAQHSGGGAPPPPVAPKEGTQFDFLVGQWELIGQPQATTLAQRIHGVSKLPGTWKAWRAMDGWGIQDELRLTDPSGYLAQGSRTTSSSVSGNLLVSSVVLSVSTSLPSTAENHSSETTRTVSLSRNCVAAMR